MSTIACPNCDRRLHHPGEGVKVKCPICATVFQVPIRARLYEADEASSRQQPREASRPARREEPYDDSPGPRRDREVPSSSGSGGFRVLITFLVLIFVLGLLCAASVLVIAIVNTAARRGNPPGFPPVPDLRQDHHAQFWYNWTVAWGDGPEAPTPEEWAFVRDPNNPIQHPSLHYVLGGMHVRAGQYQEAQREFEQGLRQSPTDPLATYLAQYRALAAYFTGQDAIELHRRLNNPLNGHQLFELLLPHVQEEGDEALNAYLLYYNQVSPGYQGALQPLLLLRVRQGAWPEVWAVSRQMGEPFLEHDWYGFYSQIVQADKTLDAYRNLSDPQRFYRLALQIRADAKKRDTFRALMDLHRANAPDDPQLAQAEGWLLAGEKKYAQAAECFQRALRGSPADKQPTLESEYFRARLLAGQGLLTWVQLGRKEEQLWSLKQHLLREKNQGQFMLLAHLMHWAGNHGQGRLLTAQCKAEQKDWDGAFAVLETGKQRGELLDENMLTIVYSFHGDTDRLLRFYRLCSDRKQGFSRLCYAGDASFRLALMEEHAQQHPKDPALIQSWMNLYLQRKDFAAAAAYLKKLKAVTPPEGQAGFLYVEQQLAIPLHRVEAYLELPMSSPEALLRDALRLNRTDVFREIIEHCEENDKPLPFWVVVAARWLEGQHQDVVDLVENRARMLRADSRTHHELLRWYVLSLLKVGRKADALQQAERVKNYSWNTWSLKLLIHAEAGDMPAFLEEAKRLPQIDAIYYDEKLGPLVRTPAYAEFRKRHPEPKRDRMGPDRDEGSDFFDFDDD